MEGFSNGLVSIANWIQQHEPDFEIHLLDLGLERQERVHQILNEYLSAAVSDLNIIGITATTASYQNALAVAALCKRVNPSTVTVLGGHHAGAQDEVILRNQKAIDLIVRGEGEVSTLAILRHFPDLSLVPGVSFRTAFGIQRNPEPPALQSADLDQIGPSFKDQGNRSMPGKFGHVTYVSARGCPLRCHFCSVANQQIRAKSISAVIRDIRHLLLDLGYRRLALEDNFFAHSPSRTRALCSALRSLQAECPFSWDCQTRVESMCSPEIVGAMDSAGCEAAYLGVEACVPRQLIYLGKTTAPENYLKKLETIAAPLLFASRIDLYLNLQTAIPAETVSERAETVQFIRRLARLARQRGKQITVFPQLHVVYPGTYHFQNLLTTGCFGKSGSTVFEAFTAWEARQEPVLKWLGEHFAHGVGGIPIGLLSPAGLREGAFEVMPSQVTATSRFLETLAEVPGITVFRYGQYLAREDPAVVVPQERRLSRV